MAVVLAATTTSGRVGIDPAITSAVHKQATDTPVTTGVMRASTIGVVQGVANRKADATAQQTTDTCRAAGEDNTANVFLASSTTPDAQETVGTVSPGRRAVALTALTTTPWAAP